MQKNIFIAITICFLTLNDIMGQGQWIAQNSGTNTFLKSVFFVSSDTGYVCDEPGYVYKTVNGGQNWNMLGQGPSWSLFFLNALHGFGSGSAILETNNGGVSWDTAFTNPAVNWITGISFPDNDHGYAVGTTTSYNGVLIKTVDGGNSWDTVCSYPTYGSWSVFFTDSLTGYIGIDGFILKTTDGGITLIPDTINASVYSIHFPVHDTGFAVTDMDGVYKTTDAGTTWNKINYPFQPILYSVYFSDVNHGCAVGGNGFSTMSLYQTNNSGSNWYLGTSGVQNLQSVFFPDTSTGYAVGSNGTILKYTSSVNINENSPSKIHVRVYPNPTIDKIAIEFPNYFSVQNAKISICSVLGQPLFQQEVCQNTTEIDLINFPKGVYFVKVLCSDNVTIKRIFKD